MKTVITGIVWLLGLSASSQAFQEFYCATNGNNLNSGDTTNLTPLIEYTSGTWVNASGVYLPPSQNPLTDGVLSGMYGSIYTQGASVAHWIGLITNVTSTSVVFSATFRSGSFLPDLTTNCGFRFGGAWAGPGNAVSFPFGFVSGSMASQGVNSVRVNFQSGTYSTTSSIASSTTFVRWQGYTATPGDGGKAVLFGTTNGSSRTFMTASGANQVWADLIFDSNGGSGGGMGDQGITITGARNIVFRCVARNMRSAGFYNASTQVIYIECEAYSNNLANTSTRGGFYTALTGTLLLRCVAHDNPGANSAGIWLDQSEMAVDCIAYNNGGYGFASQGDNYAVLLGCDAFNNAGPGFASVSASGTLNLLMERCNFVSNATWGVTSGHPFRFGFINDCGFGSGTQTNAGGTMTNCNPIETSGTVIYPAGTKPWRSTTEPIDMTIVSPQARWRSTNAYTIWTASTNMGAHDIGSSPGLPVTLSSGWSN